MAGDAADDSPVPMFRSRESAVLGITLLVAISLGSNLIGDVIMKLVSLATQNVPEWVQYVVRIGVGLAIVAALIVVVWEMSKQLSSKGKEKENAN